MRYTLTSDADHLVRQLTRNQYGVVTTEDNASLVNLMTGERVTLAESHDEEAVTMDGATQGAPLSKRERQVLEMIGDALNTHQMAERLGLSEKTIETYRARLKQKLDISDGLKLMRYAVQWRLKHPNADHVEAVVSPAVRSQE